MPNATQVPRRVSANATKLSRLDAIGRYRWLICALLFFATTSSYMDRHVLAVLAPTLQGEIGWSESQYGYIVTAFQAAYALGLLAVGRALDVVGVRLGYSLAAAFWSLATMAHAFAGSALGFGSARFALGFSQAANFPAAVKVVAEWFPKRERALATGLFNAGANVGSIITPLLVPWITVHWGWRWAFLFAGAIGFPWVFLWLACYRAPQDHPRVSPRELAYILSEPTEPAPRIPWLTLLARTETLGLLAARFISDPMWWLLLYWAPKFLHARHGLVLEHMGTPLVIIYMAANVGSVFGGWLSGWMIKRGRPVNTSRKLAMLACALMIAPIMYASRASHLSTAVLLLSLATAGQQGWAANIYTIVSDLYPREAVSSVVGICGFGGALGATLLASATGLILEKSGSYLPVFILGGSAYLVALLIVHLTSPKLALADVDRHSSVG
jgi:ACS family hexuronate transporter-like MFS transporter